MRAPICSAKLGFADDFVGLMIFAIVRKVCIGYLHFALRWYCSFGWRAS